jgi:transcription antitermination factor NusG
MPPPMEADSLFRTAPPGSGWLALHARPRCEKRLADVCARQECPVFLPLLREEHHYGNRVRIREKPLFTGYLFAVATPAQRQHLEQNRHTANIIPVVDESALLRQLQAVRQALATGQAVEVLPYVQEGRMVAVKTGPLKGLEGRVLRLKGRERVVVNIDMIGYAMALEVDATLLRPL